MKPTQWKASFLRQIFLGSVVVAVEPAHPTDDLVRMKRWFYWTESDAKLARSPKLLGELVKRFRVAAPVLKMSNAGLMKSGAAEVGQSPRGTSYRDLGASIPFAGLLKSKASMTFPFVCALGVPPHLLWRAR